MKVIRLSFELPPVAERDRGSFLSDGWNRTKRDANLYFIAYVENGSTHK